MNIDWGMTWWYITNRFDIVLGNCILVGSIVMLILMFAIGLIACAFGNTWTSWDSYRGR